MGDNRELKFESYFDVLYPLQVVDSLRTSKMHHCLPLVTIGCPSATIDLGMIIGTLKSEAYFEILYPL